MSFLFFYKIGGQEGRTGLSWGEGLVPVGGGGGKGCGRVNIVQILCVHVCKWKNETC
jgi:hypothetical protein